MNAWRLIAKDLRIYARDRVGLAFGIALPIALATIFGFAMGGMGGGGDAPRAKLYVEDHDGSVDSEALVVALEQAPTLRVVRIDLEDEEAETARQRVTDGDGPAGLVIDAGYARALANGEDLPLVVYRDPGKQIEEQLVLAGITKGLFDVAGDSLGYKLMSGSLDMFDMPEGLREPAEEIFQETWLRMSELMASHHAGAMVADDAPAAEAEADDPAGMGDFLGSLTEASGLVVEDVLGGDDRKRARRVATQAHSVSGIAVMMLLFGLVACGGTLIEEQAAGTLDRLRLAPGAGSTILTGKFATTWFIGLMQLLILFVYARLLFDVPIFRAPLALLVLSAAVAAAATGFGILFACLCKSRAQLEGLSTLVILTMSALGGSWWPLPMAPEWLQTVGHFTLTAWAMDGFQGLFWYEKGLSGILTEVGVLLLIAGVMSALAAMAWRRRIRVT